MTSINSVNNQSRYNYNFSNRQQQAEIFQDETGASNATAGNAGGSAPSASSKFSDALWKLSISEKAERGTAVEKEFSEWSKMTFAERIRATILESKGLTEEEVAQMSAEDREALEKEIRDAILEATGVNDAETALSIGQNAPVAGQVTVDQSNPSSADAAKAGDKSARD